jgi:Arc/MetJ-type ribon-helix-helix transcriptional regulator
MEIKPVQIRIWVSQEHAEFINSVTDEHQTLQKSHVIRDALDLLRFKVTKERNKKRSARLAELEDFTPGKTATNSSAISKGN